MLAEPSGERLGQLRDLDPEPPLGQIGERGGVALPVDQGLQHQPSRHPGDVGGDAGQLDPGVFQQLLQPLDLPAPFPGHQRAGPGQVPQLADRRRRHERSPDQPVGAELGQPDGVGDVALAPGQVLHLPGVDQHHLEPGVLEQVVERLPVVPGRLHHHQADPLGDQMLPQPQDRVRRRGPGRHRLHRLATPPAGDPDAHLRVPLRHIHPRTAFVDDLHDQLPSPAANHRHVRRGKGQKEGKSDARAHGNNPRFTVETLRAMLTNGLKAPQRQRRPPRRTTPIVDPDRSTPPPTQAHPTGESSRPTIRPRSGNPLLTRRNTGRGDRI